MSSNLTGWPVPFKPLREPVRSLVGKYEATLVREGSSKATVLWMSEAIEGFFYDHPRVSRPEQVLITDVEDWKEARLALGHKPNCVRRDLCGLSGFYSFLPKIGYEVDQPVVIPPYRPRPQGKPDQLARNRVTSLHPERHPEFLAEHTDLGPE